MATRTLTTSLPTDLGHAGTHLPQDKSFKVCIVSWAPFLAGAEIAAERLALGLQAAGHDVFLVLGTRGATIERMMAAGLRCLYSPIRFTDKWHWWRYRQARNGLRRLLEQERPDVIHSNDLPTHQMVSDAIRGTGIPEVCHHRWIFTGPAVDWLNKYGCERHLFVSRALMIDLCVRSGRLQASRRAVVYDGLPLPPKPAPDHRQQARQQLDLPRDRVIVTFAGQIIERKGVADLLRAWSLLHRPAAGRAELLLIGDDLMEKGKYRLEMERLAGQLRSPARFLGFQNNVNQWLLASDLAVVPSHTEPLGNATLEAMSYGLPVIGCNVGGIPEMVVHDQTGLLVPARSPEQLAVALERLIEDEATRQRFGTEGRQRCEDCFSLEVHARNVLQEYRQVIHAVPSRDGLGGDV